MTPEERAALDQAQANASTYHDRKLAADSGGDELFDEDAYRKAVDAFAEVAAQMVKANPNDEAAVIAMQQAKAWRDE